MLLHINIQLEMIKGNDAFFIQNFLSGVRVVGEFIKLNALSLGSKKISFEIVLFTLSIT